MKKKILIIIYGLYPKINDGAKQRMYSFIDCYKMQGYEVTGMVFCPIADYINSFRKKQYLRNDIKWIIYPSLPISLNRPLFYVQKLYAGLLVGLYTRIKHYDFIQSELTGSYCKYKRKSTKLITDYHGDTYYDELLFTRPHKIKIAHCLRKNLILDSLNVSDYNIFVSDKLKELFEDYSDRSIYNYSIISCGVDLCRFQSAKQSADIGIDLKDKIAIGYLGGLQKWQNIDAILDICIRLREINDNIFLIIYTNSTTEEISGKLEVIGKSNYRILSLGMHEVPSHLKLLDVGFLIREDLILNKVSSPTKLLEYLAAGVPVICTRFSGDYTRSIVHNENGFVLNTINPENTEITSLNEFLSSIHSNRNKYRSAAEKAVEGRTFENEFMSLKPFLEL